MMNFDRYNNARQYKNLINDQIQSIQLEHEKLQILRRQTSHRKLMIFFDNREIVDHRRLLSYFQRSQKWTTVDPYLHFDLNYNAVKTTISNDDLTVLHDYINDYLSNLKSSKSPDEKE